MNRNRYTQVPMSVESRNKLRNITDILKDKYGKFVGYDEAIDEIIRICRLNDEFINQQFRLIERNGQQITYVKTMEKKINVK